MSYKNLSGLFLPERYVEKLYWDSNLFGFVTPFLLVLQIRINWNPNIKFFHIVFRIQIYLDSRKLEPNLIFFFKSNPDKFLFSVKELKKSNKFTLV